MGYPETTITAMDVSMVSKLFLHGNTSHLHHNFYCYCTAIHTQSSQQVVVKMEPPSCDDMKAACLAGTEAEWSRQDTMVPSGMACSKGQMSNIMCWCGLSTNDLNNLPFIWIDVQLAKNWGDALMALLIFTTIFKFSGGV